MAIYRPPKARWPAALGAAIAGLLCGLLIGLAIGTKDPDPVEAAREIRSTLVTAKGSLEVAAIEYEESVADGDVERQAEYEGALDAVDSSRARYEEVRPALDLLSPAETARLDDLYDRCEDLMEDRAEAVDVSECLEELEVALEGSP